MKIGLCRRTQTQHRCVVD